MLDFKQTDKLFVGDEILKDFASCSDCGLCCRFFSHLTLYEKEVEEIVKQLDISLDKFIQKYVNSVHSSDESTTYSFKIPCLFLQKNRCMIYHHRFLVCRTFPLFMNLTTNKAILSGIYLCPQATQFYEGLLDFYQKDYPHLFHQIIEKEKHIMIDENGMEIRGSVTLFAPYLDWLHSE
jgi:Fe-S-cluster containining protein